MTCDCNMINSDGSRRKRSKENSGMCDTPMYKLWTAIKYRSVIGRTTKKGNKYRNTGIKLSEVWFKNFKEFITDMGERPTSNHSIDRIDNSKGYCKHNCRWATHFEQVNNRAITKKNIEWPLGISYKEEGKIYLLRSYLNKKELHLGGFKFVEDAKITKTVIDILTNESEDTKKQIGQLLAAYLNQRSTSEYEKFSKYFNKEVSEEL